MLNISKRLHGRKEITFFANRKYRKRGGGFTAPKVSRLSKMRYFKFEFCFENLENDS